MLLKPVPLTSAERQVINTYVPLDVQWIDTLADQVPGLCPEGLEVLRRVIGHCHASFDGSGYPHVMQCDAIALEAMIAAAADVFDSLINPHLFPVPSSGSSRLGCWLSG